MASTRKDLKQSFQKGKIPTQADFEALIDSAVNLLDDRVRSSPNDPLTLLPPAPGAAGAGGLLQFGVLAADKPVPTWLIRHEPRDAASPGLLFADAQGKPAIFLQSGTGNVGIGRTDPKERLDVDGRVKSGPATVGAWPPNGNYAFFGTNVLDQAKSGNYALLQGAVEEQGRTFLNSPVDIRFRIGNVDKMTLANNGSFGIGMDNPVATLDVNGKGDTSGKVSLLLRSGNTSASFGSNQIAFGYNSTDQYRHAIKSRHNAGAQAGNSLDFYLWNFGIDTLDKIGTKQVMTLDGNGRVGIGTSAPEALLHLRESVGTTANNSNGTPRSTGLGTLILDHDDAGGASSIVFRSKNNRDGADYGYIQYQDDATLGSTTGEAAVLAIGIQNDGNDHIALMPSGSVGIGKKDPKERLDVDGRVKAGPATVGAWPPNGNYAFWGANTLEQTNTINYALLQGAAEDQGRTFLNSPVDIRFRIGNVDKMILANNGNVGIGTPAPEGRLQIIHQNQDGNGGALVLGPTTQSNLRLGYHADYSWVQSHGGKPLHLNPLGNNVKINVLQLGDKWRLSGTGDHEGSDEWLRLKNAQNTAYYGGVAASKFWTGTGGYTGSDLRLKTEVSSLQQASKTVLKLRGVRFKWRDAEDTGLESIGLIAQEVEKVFPEVVITGPDGMKGINYSALIAPLIEAVKQQQVEIGELRAEIQSVRGA